MKNVCCMISLLADKQLTRSSGGIGRRVGLKIQSGAISVPVQVWPGAVLRRLTNVGLFYIQTFLPVQLRSKLLRIQAHTLQQSFSGSFCKVWPGAILKRLTNVGLFLCLYLRLY